jgi:ribosomal protein L11 methyltransferase
MLSLYLPCAADRRDALAAELWRRGTLGIAELDDGLRAWFEDGAAIAGLARRFGGTIEREPEEDWVRQTEESFPPVAIGSRFWLVPPWNPDAPPEGRVRLEINPGAACGTGWHPCTQMCLEAMERFVEPGDAVLDVGVGSGILLAAARLLGAGWAAGCDTDPDAVLIARDRVGDGLFVGSADAVRAGSCDVVVANISAEAVRGLCAEFARIARRRGWLILSGFQESEALPGEIARWERQSWQCVACVNGKA